MMTGELSYTKDPETIKKGNVSINKWIATLWASLMYQLQTAHSLQLGVTGQKCLFARNLELGMLDTLQRS